MAVSTIAKGGFGTPTESVTLPFTATSDGIMNVRIDTASVSGAAAYLYLSRNGSRNYASWNGSANGATSHMSFPVVAGDAITLYASSNATTSITFFPLR